MKKKIYISIVIATFLILLLVNNDITSRGYADKLYNLEGYKFTLSQLTEENEIQNLSFIIDSNGHFCSKILNGNYKGNFEAWDGETFYRYDAQNKHLTKIKNKPGEKVISHPFFSEVINQRISLDIKEEKLKKQFFGDVFIKNSKKADYVIKEKINFNKEINHPEKYEKIVNDEVKEYIEMKNMTKYQKSIDIDSILKLDKNVEILDL
ncbi:hypothetical protein ABE096_11130 [Robertmurraya massiliosenegalensis]|uniref:hypothetical protein n=1 Tax=Robertmurraya TaxID=2837507 RepID=UPI0039A65344